MDTVSILYRVGMLIEYGGFTTPTHYTAFVNGQNDDGRDEIIRVAMLQAKFYYPRMIDAMIMSVETR